VAPDEISEDVLEEGCYYLSKLGLGMSDIARRFEIDDEKARALAASYSKKLESHKIQSDSFDLQFWQDVKKEAEGDEKLTFVSDKGFHHSWKSEVSRLDPGALMNIYESSMDFLNADPNQRFLDYPAPKGYDPLASEREVKKAVQVVRSLLNELSRKGADNESGRREDNKPASER
jgi:hypothetical protein